MEFIGYIILFLTVSAILILIVGLIRGKRGFWLIYGIAFMLLTLVLYILTIEETFDNLDLGQLTIGSFFRFLPQTFKYFMESVATFWGLFIAPVAIVLAVIFKGISKLIAR